MPRTMKAVQVPRPGRPELHPRRREFRQRFGVREELEPFIERVGNPRIGAKDVRTWSQRQKR